MRTSNLLISGLIALGLVAVPAVASAQETLNIKRSEHPLTRPEGTIAPFGAFTFGLPKDADTTVGFNAGVDYSITNDFQVGAVVLPLSLVPDADYGNPSVHARYRFVRTAVEVAGELGFTIPVLEGSDPALSIGVPILFGLNLTTRLEIRPTIQLTFSDPEMSKLLSIPVDFVVNFTDNVFLTAGLGFQTSLDEGAEGSVVPFHIGFGYTLGAPHIDLQAGLTFPQFLRLGFPEGVDTFGAGDLINIGVSATAYL